MLLISNLSSVHISTHATISHVLYTIEKGSAYALNQNKIKSSDAAAIETTTA
jgi:hypothetical protein